MTRRDVIRTATAFLASRLDAASGTPDFFATYWNAIVKGYFDHPDPALTAPMLPALAAFAVSGRDRDGKLLAHVRDALSKTAIDTPALQWTAWILRVKSPAIAADEAFDKAHPSDGSRYWQHAANYLYWREMQGGRKHRLDPRIRELLDLAPQLIAPNGSQPLFGAGIGSRWAWLTALVLGYRQGLWPHSPGLLRAILRRNIDFFWRHGGFDQSAGRLNVKLSDRGTNDFPESGATAATPYACMQAFAFFLIPPQDPFWTAAEERLPSEQRDYILPISGANLLLSNCLETGEVRMHLAANGRFDSAFRDRYAKFSYSSRFPPCFTQRPHRATWDSALVFHDPRTGTLAGRAGITSGRILDHNKGIETDWWTEVRGARIRIVSRIFPEGDRERRTHIVTCPPSLVDAGIEAWEGSTALPVAATEPIHTTGEKQNVTASAAGGTTGVIAHSGYLANPTIETRFTDTLGTDTINVIAPRSAIVTLRAPLRAAATNLRATFLCRPSFPKGGYK